MDKPIVFAICGKEPGKLKTREILCVLCEENCHFSGFGNESAEKFWNGEHINLETGKYRVKIICTECCHQIFHKEFEIIMAKAIVKDKKEFISQVEDLLKNHKK